MPLGKQHRAGEAAIVEAGKRRGLLQLVRDFIGEDFAVSAARQLDAGRLQIAIRLVTGPVLAPESAVGDAFTSNSTSARHSAVSRVIRSFCDWETLFRRGVS